MNEFASTHEVAHVAVASLNQTVGDWQGNTKRIVRVIQEAQARNATLLLLPEMCISGYSLGDRLPRIGTFERSYQQLVEITQHTKGIIVCLGLPMIHQGVIYNAVAVVADQKIIGFSAKEHLATGDVEYEDRWYQAWTQGRVDSWIAPDGTHYPLGSLLFKAQGIGTFAFEICEDAWKGIRPGSMYALEGADLILNPSASWFTLGKHAVRRRMVTQSSREDHCAYLYASLLGCDNTRLIFDGSLFIASNGELLVEGERFRFKDFVLHDQVIDISQLRLSRREEGSWRRQISELSHGKIWPTPPVIEIEGDFSTDKVRPAPAAYWVPQVNTSVDQSLAWLTTEQMIPQAFTQADLSHLELELALALGLRDYMRKARIPAIALALSGGRDSAMVAYIVQRMFHYMHPEKTADELKSLIHHQFITAYMATENSGSATRNAAQVVADEIGAKFYDLNIQNPLMAQREVIESALNRSLSWDVPIEDLALQNVQARLRGNLIWMIANLHQALLLATSNKSEAAVGYTTMDGDTSGGLSPIADVPKSLVTLWLQWASQFYGYEGLAAINQLAPSAELRPPSEEQTDEEDLMPFEVLDRLLYGFAQLGQDPLVLFTSLWPSFEQLYQGQVYLFVDHIKKFIRLFCFAQWKRERFAVSFRLTSFDLDPKGGGRYPVIQAPFTEELADLDTYVAHHYPHA